ncbi:MAG TPA: SCO family protein [Acidimicrobiales bacterium]|nr:SCO family protein [Acidimicrobiales bacterium]
MGSEMTTGNETSREPGELNEEERALLFASANTRRDRRGVVRAGRATVSTKFIAWSIITVLVLGLGGEVAQHYFATYGKSAPLTTRFPVRTGTPTTDPNLPPLISLQVFIGLKDIGNEVAPKFSLRTQSGQRWRLASQKGHVVVLAFYNSICNDICPVVGAEIRIASHELGADTSKVDFVIVNTDPNATKISPSIPALAEPGLTDMPSVTFLTGSVDTLNHVWSAYGIRIEVGTKSDQVSHNNVLYFIGPNGNLSAYASPFGTESHAGVYSLDRSSLRTFARAVAETADSLVQ